MIYTSLGKCCKPVIPTMRAITTMAICMYITQLWRPLAAAFINQGNSTSGMGLKSNANQLLPTAGCDENRQ